MSNKLVPVSFHKDTLYCIEHEGQPFTPVKPIVENLGLSWGTQGPKLSENRERYGYLLIKIPTPGGLQEMGCIPVRKVTAFLYSINANKVRPDLRDKLIQYQEECDDVLWEYWMERKAPGSKNIPLPHRMLSAKMVFEAANKRGNSLAQALDLVYQDATGTSALELADITLEEPLALPPSEKAAVSQESTHYVSVTQIGNRYNMSGQAINKILVEHGLITSKPRIVCSKKSNGAIVKKHNGYIYTLTDNGRDRGGRAFPEGNVSWSYILWDEKTLCSYLDKIIR